MADIHLKSPAKLNLHLRVFPLDESGYHVIESIFYPISLCDEIHISTIESFGKCKIFCGGNSLPAQNTLTKAYAVFCETTGINQGVQIVLTKNIPIGSGLGGGSSDAASVLLGLNDLFQAGLSIEQLTEIAVNVGCDVPFFITDKPALVQGYGEKVTPLEARDDLFFVVIYPKVFSSTNRAYRMLDEWYTKNADTVDWIPFSALAKTYAQPIENWKFQNSFAPPLLHSYAIIEKAIHDEEKHGATYANITGSGSAVFGVFDTEVAAKEAHRKLSNIWKTCIIAKSLKLP